MNMNTSIRNERDIYVQYLNDISKYPLLSREQEVLLLKKIRQGNRAAMDLLVKSNLRFVVNIANLYRGQGLDVGELISEGNMGLMEAARLLWMLPSVKTANRLWATASLPRTPLRTLLPK